MEHPCRLLGQTLTHLSVSTASSGDNTLVTGVTGKTIRVYQMLLTTASSTTLAAKSASTSLTGAMTTATGVPIVGNQSPSGHPLFECASGESFVLALGGNVQTSGYIKYSIG